MIPHLRFLYHALTTIDIAQDVEHQSALMGPNISRQESTEFENLRQPSNRTSTTNYDSRTDFGTGNHPAEHGLEMASDPVPFSSVVVGQIPTTGAPNKTSSKIDGTSSLVSTTSSCNSRLHHELSSETIENHRDALFGTTVGTSPSGDTNVLGEAA